VGGACVARARGECRTRVHTREDALATVHECTGGYRCGVSLETTGVPRVLTQGMSLSRRLGRFVECAVFGKDTALDWSIIGDRKGLDVRGAHLGPYCYPVAIALLARGLVTPNGIVTHGFTLEERDEAIRVANSLG
ncbi:zinc-binding dehydrogenase, partial [Burkholderia thailandensis]|uniref:zinc-binding dehydrogenase n=1 Tax=Burkholderia thailandensis TaxID=57975 RepID=UPI00217EF306